MKQITLSFALVSLLNLLFILPVSSQDYKLIGLNKTTIEAPILEYYVLDVFDSRELQSSIGIAKSGNQDEIVMLNFFRNFHKELLDYYNLNFPAAEGNIPIILNFKRLWISEYEKEGSSYSTCEIELEFLTPIKQKFYDCSEKIELLSGSNQNVIQENIIECLNKCMHQLKDPELKNIYNTVLNSDTPPSTSVKNQAKQNSPNNGSKNKAISTAPKARITLQFGYTHRTKRIPEGVNQDTKDYYRKLKNTFNIGSDINFFLNENSLLGISGSYSQARSTLPDLVDIDSTGNIIAQGDLNTNDKLFYVGPSYFNRSSSSNAKRHLLFGLTMGYYGYNQNLEWIGETVKVTGGTIGYGFSLGVDFLTSENFAVGLQASILMGWLKKVKADGVLIELAEKENLTRIDLTIGFRFLP